MGDEAAIASVAAMKNRERTMPKQERQLAHKRKSPGLMHGGLRWIP